MGKHYGLCALAAVLLLNAPTSAQRPLLVSVDMLRFPNRQAPTIHYLTGIDTLTGRVTAPCVTGDVPIPFAPRGGTIEYNSYLTNTAVDVATTSRMNLSASFGYNMFSSTSSYTAIADSRVNSKSFNAVVRAVFQGEPILLPSRPRLTAEARSLLDRGNYVGFLNKCGDAYVSAGSFGAGYEARLTIDSSSDSEYNSMSATFSAAMEAIVARGSVSADVSRRWRQFLSTNHTEMQIAYAGDVLAVDPVTGTNNAVAHCPDDALDRLPTEELSELAMFGRTISCRASVSPHPLEWSLTPYRDIDSRAPSYDASRNENADVDNVMKLYTRRASLHFALAHPSQFEPLDVVAAKKEESALSADIRELSAAYLNLVQSRRQDGTLPPADAKAFSDHLTAIAAGVGGAFHRTHLYQPDLRTPGKRLIAYFPGDYPVVLAQVGPYATNANDGSEICPPRCRWGPASIVFEDRNSKQIDKVDLALNRQVPVPLREGGVNAYVIAPDGDPSWYGDNHWLDGAGIAASEIFANNSAADHGQVKP